MSSRVSRRNGYDLFASALKLMRPVRFTQTEVTDFENINDHERDTDRMPNELISIGRNVRFVGSTAFLFLSKSI